MDDPASREKVAGLAFVAQFALRAHLVTLASVNVHGECWEVIARCGAALSEVHKSLAALEVAVCEVERLPVVENSYFSELERSIQVRRAYAMFRRELGVSDTPTPSTLYARLRRVGTSIAKLVGREIYPSARVHDRWMIRKLQRRVRDWLTQNAAAASAGGSDAYATSGFRLWEEVVNIAELFMQVNNRAELREHDISLLDSAAERVSRSGCTADEAARLTPLWGRDQGIDFFLDNPHRFECTAWVDAVQRARAKLGVSPAHSPSSTYDFAPRRSIPHPESNSDGSGADDTF